MQTPRVPASGRTALVVGITGAFGSAVAQALARCGWRLRALHREPSRARNCPGVPAGVDWIAGDAMHHATVAAAARSAQLLIHAANPPRYRRWRELAIPMLAHSIMAATASGARLIFPGNIYNFGREAVSPIDERCLQRPCTRKGAIRVDMEGMLEAAAKRGLRSLVVRAGDFFGPHATSSWFGAAMVKPGRGIRSVVYPGVPEVGHAWAYLPDLAEAVARLADIETGLADFETVHFGGHWVEPGIGMAEAIRRAAGDIAIPIRPVPWPLLQLASPFSPFLRELLEMRYLWRTPLQLDNRKLLGLIGSEPHTPLDTAVAASLASLGCLPA